MKQKEHFGSRWGMMLVMLGMAVGTGNIWRFPRIAAKNGGGEFLIAWVVFLFLWSIPLILLEFGMGRKTRSGPIKGFVKMMGPKYAWMGALVAFVTVAIMFYYSVVAGWTVRYTAAAVVGQIPGEIPGEFWKAFTNSPWPLLTHAIMIGLAVWVVSRGVGMIEKVAKVLMPMLLLLVVILTIRALTLPGASNGLSAFFTVEWGKLGNPVLWLEALTQNAWDTGAGWGLVLCYAAYLREKEDTALNGIILPIGNNLISLLAGIMIFCTVFTVIPEMVTQFEQNPEMVATYSKGMQAQIDAGAMMDAELVEEDIFGAGNEGITFVWMPQLFKELPWGQGLMSLFFLALAFAAFTSLMAMMELGTRALRDIGFARKKAILVIGAAGFLLGMPSALNMSIFLNQDWVWAVALVLAGLFFAIAVIKNGVKKFREEQLNHENSNVKIGAWWDIVVTVLIPLQAFALLGWFFYGAWGDAAGKGETMGEKLKIFLTPISEYNAGTVIVQLAILIFVLLVLNKWIANRVKAAEQSPEEE